MCKRSRVHKKKSRSSLREQREKAVCLENREHGERGRAASAGRIPSMWDHAGHGAEHGFYFSCYGK